MTESTHVVLHTYRGKIYFRPDGCYLQDVTTTLLMLDAQPISAYTPTAVDETSKEFRRRHAIDGLDIEVIGFTQQHNIDGYARWLIHIERIVRP